MNNAISEYTIHQKFEELYGSVPLLIEAPGRINLIGEHTDYNDGFVLAAAIDKSAVFALAKNNHGRFRFYASDLDQEYVTENISPAPYTYSWANYLLGVLAQFKKQGLHINGLDCVFQSTIPMGSGMSSSAAIECGFAFGLNELYETKLAKYELVKMAQYAEHEYAGVLCGIMDQYACVFGKQDHVFRLDCRTNKHEYFRFEMDDFVIALCDTGVRHKLASGEYNIRRQECEEGVRILHEFNPEIKSLRDADTILLEKYKNRFDPVIYKRCLYVLEENERVMDACEALVNKDFFAFGELMYQSHDGLQHKYEVSCTELDILVEISRGMDNVPGARMMGGGFGGCTINLLKKSYIGEFRERVNIEYEKQTGLKPKLYFVNIGDGVRILK